jgi:hypothetical protein
MVIIWFGLMVQSTGKKIASPRPNPTENKSTHHTKWFAPEHPRTNHYIICMIDLPKGIRTNHHLTYQHIKNQHINQSIYHHITTSKNQLIPRSRNGAI